MKFIRDLGRDDMDGKHVLIRVGMDVPIENGKVMDDSRIISGLDTIKYCIDNGAKVVLINHIGRPTEENRSELTNKAIAERLAELLGRNVDFVNNVSGSLVAEKISLMDSGDILVLENVRFHEGEEKDDDIFARSLASLGDIYVNDAFSVSHRPHASVHAIARYLPSYAGMLMEKELSFMNRVLKAKERPFVVVLGGKKVGDKIPVIEKMIGNADMILVGGAMAYTFLKVRGHDVKNSIVDSESVSAVTNILEKAKNSNTELVLPVDSIYNDKGSGCDIGPKTIELFKTKLKNAAMIFWNGPMGIFEDARYANGTEKIARMIADSTAVTVVGGGDTLAAVARLGLENAYKHTSTGGGASLEFISGKMLPGIAALNGIFDVTEIMKRRVMIAGNWKMNKTIDETIIFCERFRDNAKKLSTNTDVLVCAPYTCLHTLIEMFHGTNVMVGAQDMHWEDAGAYTGEISGPMLKDIGCTHVILGHSERRQYFGELNKTINKKIKAALRNELTPIVCLGETLEQREDEKTMDVIRNQFERCFADVMDEEMRKIIIAYEPVWAIGTGRTAMPEQAQEVHAFIRLLIREKYNNENANAVRILYGGSMKPENAAALTAQTDVDGGLVGGASLDADSFAKIIENC